VVLLQRTLGTGTPGEGETALQWMGTGAPGEGETALQWMGTGTPGGGETALQWMMEAKGWGTKCRGWTSR